MQNVSNMVIIFVFSKNKLFEKIGIIILLILLYNITSVNHHKRLNINAIKGVDHFIVLFLTLTFIQKAISVNNKAFLKIR